MMRYSHCRRNQALQGPHDRRKFGLNKFQTRLLFYSVSLSLSLSHQQNGHSAVPTTVENEISTHVVKKKDSTN